MHAATVLSDGRVLVTGGLVGTTATSDGVASSTVEIYDPVANTWTTTGSMRSPRSLHAAVLLRDGRVLVAGGYDTDNNPIASAEIFDPARGRWEVAPSLPSPHGHPISALLPGGEVLVAGGEVAKLKTTAAAAVYQPGRGTWREVAAMPGPRNAAASTSLADGDVLVASGYASLGGSGAVLASDAFAFDAQTRQWRQAGTVTTPRSNATATLLPRGRVLLAGGWDAQNTPLASTELYRCGRASSR
jgi:N-acetylneuraminic acid mutarotase